MNVFPDSEAYEWWTEDISDAAVMALSVEKLFTRSQRAVQSYVAETGGHNCT